MSEVITKQNLFNVFHHRLRADLQGVSGIASTDFCVGDARIRVRGGKSYHYANFNAFRVRVETKGYEPNIKGSNFALRKDVQPESIDKWMTENYPSYLEKIKAAIDRIQKEVDAQKEYIKRSQQSQAERDERRRFFIAESDLESILNRWLGSSDSYWQSKGGVISLNLHSDGTFDLDKCRAKLSLEQVKQIIAIVEVKS